MPLRQNHGKKRVIAPQLKEMTKIPRKEVDLETVRRRARDNLEMALERFSKNGPPDTVLERTFDLFKSISAEIDDESFIVQDQITSRCYFTALSRYYLEEAGKIGFTSDRGMKYVQMADMLDGRVSKRDTMLMAFLQASVAKRRANVSKIQQIEATVMGALNPKPEGVAKPGSPAPIPEVPKIPGGDDA